MTGSILGQAIVYLAAAVVCVPLAKRVGMGSVLGYLLAGILIGPFCLGFVGHEGEDIMHFAEFGVVMMLFLIGLELEPAHFLKMRNSILGLGSLQLGLTSLILFGGFTLLGFDWRGAAAAALALALSSTAIVMQSLKEKGLGSSQAGRSSFAVLLFQDIAVIPILALLPFLALQSGAGAEHGHGPGLLDGLPVWLKAGSVLLAVALVFILGRYVVVPFLRIITKASVRELSVAAALLIIVAIAFIMQLVGLSPALGAFLAGVLLANSEFRHELESDIEPFKGLLLGLFFIAVGASINFKLLAESPGTIMSLVMGIIVIKAAVLILAGKLFRLSFDQNTIFAIGLSQVGEFAFVLLAFISRLEILGSDWTDTLMAVTAISMTLTPVLMLINERLVLPRFGTPEQEEKEADAIDTEHSVIIAGFGSFGSTLGRFLRANGVEATILDSDSDQVDLLRRMGFKVFYGDATRLDILHSAGADSARILFIATDNFSTVNTLVATAKKHFPNLQIMARAGNNLDAHELLDLGVDHIYRDFLHTSVQAGVDVLSNLGFRRFSATRAGQNFMKHDEAAMHHLAPHRHDESTYISNTKEQIQLQEQLLASDRAIDHAQNDHAWDSSSPVTAATEQHENPS
ncbi:MAG: potassium transporter [Desulfuromonas sp.]|uniref:monovalent cation:proton antiporter-2 (CPA2) family protein n=1 Tax=Desulfuromonas sp. TaxID=892 RepID=UPI000CA751B5|nr:monovalent cation:proton antiporter-2 (CPA2) family protein [Desulfuromonas sp.]PLX86762.1 MAG: potassium transporter [Desulfuromonas sp.]